MDAKLVITETDIKRLPMSWYNNERKKIEKLLKKAVDSMWDNSRLMLDHQFHMFNFIVTKENFRRKSPMHERCMSLGEIWFVHTDKGDEAVNVFSFNLWSLRGASLGNETFLQNIEQPIPSDILKTMINLCELWISGRIHCSDCKKVTDADGARKRHYFAGRYCQSCWNRKWKAVEAAESYS